MNDNQPQLRHVQCLDGRGLHRMAYWQWERSGGASDRVLVCVHGVTRQGRDFDVLARAMQDGWRVVCPDVVGRGESDRLADPKGYQLPGYVADMVTLLARLDAKTVHWFGTSMGALIGIGLAGLPGSPISEAATKEFEFGIGPGCTGENGMGGYTGQATPNVRVQEVCEALNEEEQIRCCIESICDTDFSDAIGCLAGVIQTVITPIG